LAEIAVKCERPSGASDEGNITGPPTAHLLAQGDGWTVSDVICTSGAHSRPFEECHSRSAIAIVVAGTFQYRARAGYELMTPGSLLLGNVGQSFECGHQHSTGDRCVSFSYTPEFFERLAREVGDTRARPEFRAQRLPPIRALSPVIARTHSVLAGAPHVPWDELGIQLAAAAVRTDRGLSAEPIDCSPSGVARVTKAVRLIEGHPEDAHDIAVLASEARLSPYHFLRTFQNLTGVTPHQYLLRVRLRRAAIRLSTETTKILDIALDCGFGDVSNFNRTFRAEFGVNPRAYRKQTRRPVYSARNTA
jgi:AraC family transcriptional regulator